MAGARKGISLASACKVCFWKEASVLPCRSGAGAEGCGTLYYVYKPSCVPLYGKRGKHLGPASSSPRAALPSFLSYRLLLSLPPTPPPKPHQCTSPPFSASASSPSSPPLPPHVPGSCPRLCLFPPQPQRASQIIRESSPSTSCSIMISPTLARLGSAYGGTRSTGLGRGRLSSCSRRERRMGMGMLGTSPMRR